MKKTAAFLAVLLLTLTGVIFAADSDWSFDRKHWYGSSETLFHPIYDNRLIDFLVKNNILDKSDAHFACKLRDAFIPIYKSVDAKTIAAKKQSILDRLRRPTENREVQAAALLWATYIDLYTDPDSRSSPWPSRKKELPIEKKIANEFSDTYWGQRLIITIFGKSYWIDEHEVDFFGHKSGTPVWRIVEDVCQRLIATTRHKDLLPYYYFYLAEAYNTPSVEASGMPSTTDVENFRTKAIENLKKTLSLTQDKHLIEIIQKYVKHPDGDSDEPSESIHYFRFEEPGQHQYESPN